MAVMAREISVLVHLGDHSRVVKTEAVVEAVQTRVLFTFGDVITPETRSEDIILKMKDENWGGVFIDVQDQQPIPDKSVLKAVISQKVYIIKSLHEPY